MQWVLLHSSATNSLFILQTLLFHEKPVKSLHYGLLRDDFNMTALVLRLQTLHDIYIIYAIVWVCIGEKGNRLVNVFLTMTFRNFKAWLGYGITQP